MPVGRESGGEIESIKTPRLLPINNRISPWSIFDFASLADESNRNMIKEENLELKK